MNYSFIRIAIHAVAVSLLGAVYLPTPSMGGLILPSTSFAVQYGDMSSYSLAFLNQISGSNNYSVQSSPGQIDNGIVIGTGASGVPVNTNFNGMNNAYALPSGAGGLPYFSTTNISLNPGSAPNTGPAVDSNLAWNADVASLRSFLGTTGNFVVLFNLNESGTPQPVGEAGLESTDLLAWAKFTLTGSGVMDKSFFFSQFDNPLIAGDERSDWLTPSNLGAPDETDITGGASFANLDARWGYAHSYLTLNLDNTLKHFGPRNAGENNSNTIEIAQNLGENQAAFAVYNSELDQLIRDPSSGYQNFSLELNLSRINNGFEQVFLLNNTIVDQQQTSVVPEPSMFAIGSLICASAAFWRRKDRRDSSMS